MSIILHCFGASGHSYKAALALELAGLNWSPREVRFFEGEARTDNYRDFNIMGEAPVLEHGDIRLTQSGVILHYITELTGKFDGATRAEQREVLRWLLWDTHKLSSVMGLTRFLVNFLPPEKRPGDVIAFHQGRLKAAYKVLNTHLAGRDWIVGDGPTHADFSCCGYFYYPEPFGWERGQYPEIDAWLDRIAALPGWKPPYDLMPGKPPVLS